MSLPDHPPRFDTDIVRPFWEALERGEFRLPACSVCGAWQWYPYDFVRCHDEARLADDEVRRETGRAHEQLAHGCQRFGSGAASSTTRVSSGRLDRVTCSRGWTAVSVTASSLQNRSTESSGSAGVP